MRNRNIFKSFLAVTLFTAIFSAAVTAQTYSGQAFAGGVKISVVGNPVVTTNVLDTGDLPSAGGTVTQTDVGLYALPGGVLTLGDRTASASAPPGGPSSTSSASVNSLNLGAVGITNLVTAGVITANSGATCPGQVLSGSSNIANLVVNGSPVTVTGDPNQFVTVNLGSSRVLTVVINEQIVNPRSITVNALHVTVADPLNLTTTEVIVVSARSGINCGISPVSSLYSGRGTGVRVQQNSLLLPHLSTIVADTGWMPSPGTAPGPAITSTTTGAGVSPILTTGVVVSSTEGGNPTNTDKSSSEVDNLGITLANLPLLPDILSLSANVVKSNTQCSCSLGVPTCTGDSDLVGLTASVLGVPVTIPLDFPPNFTLINVNLPGVANLLVVVNEQSTSSLGTYQDINVNALHVNLGVLTSLLVDTDIKVAHSHSDIACALAPSAAPVTLTGRVYDSFGRGLTRTTVTLTDGMTFNRSVTTNSFGYYSFSDIPSGNTYFVGVVNRQYQFSPQVVTLTDSLSGLDFRPDSGRTQTANKVSVAEQSDTSPIATPKKSQKNFVKYR